MKKKRLPYPSSGCSWLFWLAQNVALVVVGALTVSAQSLKEEIAATPGKSGGIYYAYPYTSDSIPPFPDGYEPVYISHYGRHGSRWAINEKQYPIVADVLKAEEKKGNLTDSGRGVLRMVETIALHAEGHAGELSPLGQRQHKGIARRMMERTPSLFRDSARISALSSIEPRCIVSMAAFSESLKEKNPSLRITRSASPGDMAFISYSTPEAKAFSNEKAGWWKNLDKFRDSVVDYSRLSGMIFKNPDKVKLPKKFWKTLHDIAITTQNVDLDVDLLSIFTPDELYGFWQAINYGMYVRHANAPVSGMAGMKSARSLLLDIVRRADEALAALPYGTKEGTGGDSGQPTVQLRFGHDTALIRLLALMGIDGCAESEADPRRYCEAWQDFRVSPMGANLQLIFFRPVGKSKVSADDYLVLILHNERPATLLLTSDNPPYYRWQDLRARWLSQTEI